VFICIAQRVGCARPGRLSGRAGLAGLVLLFGSNALQSVVAEGDTRTLSLRHIHTGEALTITYKRAGHYDQEALKKLDWLLRDWRREQSIHMDPHLFDIIWEVYRDVGARQPIEVVCGYRSPQTNSMLRHRSRGVAQHSQHMLGRAMDFYIPGVPLEQIRNAGLQLQRGGVGFYPTSGSPFVHLDTGSIRHWPRMTHDQLVRVFPDGKTVHVPSNGKPLARYAAALAEVRHRGASPSATLVADARDAGEADADMADAPAQQHKPGFFARMFGFRSASEEPATEPRAAEEVRKPSAEKPHVASHEVKTVRLRTTVPVRAAETTRQAKFTLASAAPTSGMMQNAGETTHATGKLSGAPAAAAVTAFAERTDARAATPPGATNVSGERLVWIPGPEGGPAPRPPHEVTAAAKEPQATVETESVATPGGVDPAPAGFALAYASGTSTVERRPRPAPMGSLGAPAASASTAAHPMIRGGRIENPWLRSIVVAPSVHYSMNVSVLGPTDYRVLGPLFAKPSYAIPMMFTEEPPSAISSEAFAGAAIEFPRTVSFASRTARLN
jgi:uncharacterized protein YcbK (DUF882 family)